VVVENFRPGTLHRLGIGPDEMLERSPGLVYCSLPGFGSDDPRARVPAWEQVVMAAGGGCAPITPGIPPLVSPVPLASIFGAALGATAITAALVAREREGAGQWVEVPLFDALFEAIGSRGLSFERGEPWTVSFGSGIYVCSDGRRVTFLANWHRHLVWFLQAVGHESWLEEGVADFDRLKLSTDVQGELQRRLTELFATRPAVEWERVARAHGCSIAMVRSTAEWLADPVSIQSRAVVEVEDPDHGPVKVPGLAVTSDETPDWRPAGRPRTVEADIAWSPRGATAGVDGGAAHDGVGSAGSPLAPAAGRGPLAGFRVLEMARVLAAPTAGKLLAQLGAEVVKIDVDPAHGTAITREPFMHEQINRGKHTLIADLRTEAGRAVFERIAPTCDVLVQNFTLGTAERLGIDHASLRRRRPDVVSLYLNAFGTTGPWAGFRGFAELANVSSGLTDHVLRGEFPASGSSPVVDLPRWFYTDYAAGVLGAFGATLGLYSRVRSGTGGSFQTSLFAATALEQITWLASGDASPARGEAATRVVRARDGWVCVSGPSSALARLAEDCGWDADEPTEISRPVREGPVALTVDKLCRAATAAGAGAHRVMTVPELMRPGGWADVRGLRLTDETEEFGQVVMPGPVVRFARTPMQPGHFPAPFGQNGGNPVKI
jgi:crotonobetainyl-CoA:carnitine CoA-transferase CaiB-like acyl-CoA transferase